MALGDGNYIFITTGAGHIWFTRRAADGSWVPAVREQNPQLPGDAGAQGISTRGVSELQHLAIVAFGGGLWHSRWDSQGQATVFGDVQSTAAGRVGGFLDVDATHGPAGTASAQELFLVGCTVDGKVWDTTRSPDGTWRPFEDMQTVPNQVTIGTVRNVSCASGPPNATGPAVHVVVLTNDYRLFHTRWDLDSDTFSTFLDIETTAAGEAGSFTDVSCAWDGSALHVCAVAGGTIKYTRMPPDGTWTPFADVKTLAASDPGLIEKVGCAVPSLSPGPGPVSTGCNFVARMARFVVQPFSRRAQPGSAAPLGATEPSVQVVVVTSAQRLWHTERTAGAAWTPFVDVETTSAGAIGSSASRPRNVAL